MMSDIIEKMDATEKVERVFLSPPWIEYAREIYILFGMDPEIQITYDPDEVSIKLYINNAEKAAAIEQILPIEKIFGNVTLKITVIPSNTQDALVDIYRKAFNGNPIFKEALVDTSPMSAGLTYVMFAREVVQFFNDQLNNPDSMKSALYEDIARDVFENASGVFFNTETGDDFIVWP